MEYAHRNLINTKTQLQLLKDHPYLDAKHIPQDIHVLIPLLDYAIVNSRRALKHDDNVFDVDIGHIVLTKEQQHVKDNIV